MNEYTDIAAPGKTLYYTTRGLPNQQAVIALHAFFREVYGILFKCREPMAARLRLQWWRDEISTYFHNQATHPILHALTPQKNLLEAKKICFFDCINAIDDVFDRTGFLQQNAVDRFIARAGGNRDKLIATVLGLPENISLNAFSLGVELTHFLRNFPAHQHSDCLLLPSAASKALVANARALKTPEFRAVFFRPLIATARKNLQATPTNLPYFTPTARVTLSLLNAIEKRKMTIYQRISPIKKLCLALKTNLPA